MRCLLPPISRGLVSTPGIGASLVICSHHLGGWLCYEDTWDTHMNYVSLQNKRPEDKTTLDVCRMHRGPMWGRHGPTLTFPPHLLPPHTHLQHITPTLTSFRP